MQILSSLALLALSPLAFSLTSAYSIGTHEKRAFTGRGTFYDPSGNVGACGSFFSPNDLAVAIPNDKFSGSCGRRVSITSGGTTVQATVLDMCVFCGSGDLDMTPALFQRFASLDAGIINITWDFI